MTQSNNDQFCVKWSEYESSMLFTLKALYRTNDDTKDVTIVCDDGKVFKSHKFILTASSGFFNKLFSFQLDMNHKNPIIYLTNVDSDQVENLLQFMYLGQVFVSQKDFRQFMIAAEKLRVQGLTDLFNNMQKKTESNNFQKMETTKLEAPTPQPQPQNISQVFSNDVTPGKIVTTNIAPPLPAPTPPLTPPTHSQTVPVTSPSTTEATPTAAPGNVSDVTTNLNFDMVPSQMTTVMYDPVQEFLDGIMIKQELISSCDSVTKEEHVGTSTIDHNTLNLSVMPMETDNNAVSLTNTGINEGSKPVIHKCDKCNYQSTKAFNVKKHIAAIHDGVRYPCQFCSYKATESGHLKKHIRAKHTQKNMALN